MNRLLIAISALAIAAPSASSREPEEWWARQRGITQGVLVEGSTSPDGKYALFEFNHWDGDTPDSATTATSIGLAPADRTTLLFIINSRTKWMTDKEVTSFLSIEWNDISTLLATHDSGARHSKLNIYRISKTGTAVSLKIPDLLEIAAKKLGVTKESVSSSGQVPLRWRSSVTVEVSVRLATPKAKLTTTIPLHIDDEGRVTTQ